MKEELTKRRKRYLAASRPHEPPLDIPPGGGASGSPYPSFDVANRDKWALDWDEKTRRLVIDRVNNVPVFRFFSPEEGNLLEAICARALPQADRLEEARIPIAPWIDQRLYMGEGRGYRYEDMPPDGKAYRLGLSGIDQEAQTLFGRSFMELNGEQQDEVVQKVVDGKAPGGVWKVLPARRFFELLMSDILTNYYAHPAAWAEIGFSGPASPRGHIRLELDQRDPWEAEEKAPRSSVEIVRQAGRTGEKAAGKATH